MWGKGASGPASHNGHGREGSAGIQGSGTPLASLPQEPVCLKEDLEGLAKLELGARYGSWAQYPPWIGHFHRPDSVSPLVLSRGSEVCPGLYFYTHYSIVPACRKGRGWERIMCSLYRRGLSTCGGLIKTDPRPPGSDV